jgi:hypothetical protein
MNNLIGGFTIEEYIHLTGSLIFEVRNCLAGSVGFGEPAQKELQPSHPASAHVATALKSAERAFAALKQFDREFYRHSLEAQKQQTDVPDAGR